MKISRLIEMLGARLHLVLPVVIFISSVLASPNEWVRYEPSSIAVEIETPAPATVQVFFKVGRRYTEKYSRAARTLGTGGFETLGFKVPGAGISKIRLDPGASAGEARIGRICLETSAASRCWGPGEMFDSAITVRGIEGMRVEDGSLRFNVTGEDPQLRLALPLDEHRTYAGPNILFFLARLMAALGLFVLIRWRPLFAGLLRPVPLERIYVAVGLGFGLIFVFLTPPFQSPDEFGHFSRAYQLSGGGFRPVFLDPVVGGYVPASFDATYAQFSHLIHDPGGRTDFAAIRSLLDLPLDEQRRIFVAFPNTALSFPLNHFPQAVAIGVGRVLQCSPLVMMYMGRLADLLTAVFFVVLAIRMAPHFKWIFFIVGMTPMYIFISSTLSADVVVNGACFLFAAHVLKCASAESRLSDRDNLLLFMFGVLLALAKQPYLPIGALVLVIPPGNFGGKARYAFTLAVFGAVLIAVSVLWTLATQDIYAAYIVFFSSALGFDLSPEKKTYLISHDPLRYAGIVLDTLRTFGKYYVSEFVGVLGTLNVRLPMWVYASFPGVMLLVGLARDGARTALGYKDKLVFLFILASSGILILTALYISWSPVEGPVIEGVQGRYFIPLAVPLLLLMRSARLKIDIERLRLPLLVYNVIVLAVSAHSLYAWYYA